jgi:hypothetical protein
MDKKNILLTYDYELFLGKDSGDLYTTLINPTNKILDYLSKYNAKGLFFIDATFLVIIKELECFNIVKKQIQDIVNQGHDIGLHIHSHWYDAKQTQNCRWTFDKFEHFRLHSYNNIEIESIVRTNYTLLSDIVYEVNQDYKIDTFRAGGWCIQPFDKLVKVFNDIGIKYDLSVLPGIKDDDMPRHYYNYTNYPKNKYSWKFSNDILHEDTNGHFIEISNTVFNMNIIDLMKNRKLIKNYKIAGDGKGAGKKKTFFEQLKRVRWNVKQIVSSDAIDIDIFKKYIDKIQRDTIVYVAHPKLFSDNSFIVLEYICKTFNCLSYKEIKIDE